MILTPGNSNDRMLRVFFNAIALVFGLACICEASAQSSLPPCASTRGVWNRCFGTRTSLAGKYVGEFRDGTYIGQGTFTWPDGRKYVGEWKDGKRNGQGTMTFPNSRKYIGEWKDGTPNGQGTESFPDGRAYVGEWKDGERNGRGTETTSNGAKYVGEFRDGKPNGQGTLTAPFTFVGEFSERWPSEHVTLTTGIGKYMGEFRDGTQEGQGTFIFPSGQKYVGAWQANKKHGQGKEYSSSGELLREGYWISDDYYGPTPPAGLKVESGIRVKMIESGGVYHVPVLINDALKLDFVVDSGASDVSIPPDVVLTLIRTGTIKESDFVGTEKYQLADGSIASSRTFMIKSLKVGDRTVTNVRASITDLSGPLLLGQSFLSKFKSWSQDNASHELVLQ